jgi:DNA-binding transcriptional LysR family regulator
MDLRHLRYFVAVAEELHFGRAAARLHIAQPPLSRQIRTLEDELGLRLFERNRAGVALTEAGKVFLVEVGALFEQLEHAVTRTKQAARGELGTLRIGYVGSAVYSGLPGIVRTFRASVPGVVVSIRQMSPTQQVSALLEGAADLGFARGPVHEPSLRAQTVLDEELLVALPAGHALSRHKVLALPMLASEPFVVAARARGPGYHDYILSLCRAAGFSPRIVQEGSHLDVLSLVAAGMGIALVPASLRDIRKHDVDYRALRERPRTELVAISRKTAHTPALRAFLLLLDKPWTRTKGSASKEEMRRVGIGKPSP